MDDADLVGLEQVGQFADRIAAQAIALGLQDHGPRFIEMGKEKALLKSAGQRAFMVHKLRYPDIKSPAIAFRSLDLDGLDAGETIDAVEQVVAALVNA